MKAEVYFLDFKEHATGYNAHFNIRHSYLWNLLECVIDALNQMPGAYGSGHFIVIYTNQENEKIVYEVQGNKKHYSRHFTPKDFTAKCLNSPQLAF